MRGCHRVVRDGSLGPGLEASRVGRGDRSWNGPRDGNRVRKRAKPAPDQRPRRTPARWSDSSGRNAREPRRAETTAGQTIGCTMQAHGCVLGLGFGVVVSLAKGFFSTFEEVEKRRLKRVKEEAWSTLRSILQSIKIDLRFRRKKSFRD